MHSQPCTSAVRAEAASPRCAPPAHAQATKGVEAADALFRDIEAVVIKSLKACQVCWCPGCGCMQCSPPLEVLLADRSQSAPAPG